MAERGRGTAATRDFYDRIGWRRQNGTLIDVILFGKSDGPIHRALDTQRKERLRQLAGGPGLRLAELGCGGTPATFLAERCKAFIAVDFSSTGLCEAAIALKATNVAFDTVEADMTALPFEDDAFDVIYSANALYHIDTVEGQASALREAMRVVRPGGRAIFVQANPFPLLFPYQLTRRVLAMTPGLNTVLNRLRRKPPLPYLPMPLGWIKRQLESWGDVKITGQRLPTVGFDRLVSEHTLMGRLAWRGIQWLETHHTDIAARLGFLAVIVVNKTKAENAHESPPAAPRRPFARIIRLPALE
jgi:ubiquinone/menaquinone biosynthesis C-methylase UbiE